MVSLTNIFFVFLKLGALTFGGGYAMLPIIREEILKREWIEDDIFLDYIAIAQVSPGMIAVNIATITGMHLRRRIGALVAVTGVILPSLIVIIGVASLLSNFGDIIWIQKALKGIILAVIVLLGFAAVSIGRKAIRKFYLQIYALTIFGLVTFLNLATVYAILIAFLIGTIHTIITMKLGDAND